jgi:hypothetical protein
MGCIFIFFVFFEELLYAATWLKLPRGKRAGCQKGMFVFLIDSWNLTFFQFFILFMELHDVIFNVTTQIWTWMIWNFSKKITCFKILECMVMTPFKNKYLPNVHKSKVEIWAMCAQLGLKVMSKRPKKGRLSNFCEFSNGEAHCKKYQKRKLWCLVIISWIPWSKVGFFLRLI